MFKSFVYTKQFTQKQKGVSLIEVMVGLGVGMVASLVIMNSFSSSEAFRRNVGGVADMVQSASIGGARLNLLFEEAGAALVQGRNVWGCTLTVSRGGEDLLPASNFPAPFNKFPGKVRVLPVAILDSGDENKSDVIMVMSGSSASANRDMPFSVSGTTITVVNPNGLGLSAASGNVDDLILAVPQDVVNGPGACRIVQIAASYSGGTPVNDTFLGKDVMPSEAQIVAPASYTSIALNSSSSSYGSLSGVTDSPSAFHLGRENASTFSLVSVNDKNELIEYDLLKRRGVQVYGENVFILKARYGVDDGVGGIANDNVVDEWISPTEWPLNDLMNGTFASEQRVDQIKAVRIGLVIRSSQPVRTDNKPTSIELFADIGENKKYSRTLTKDEQQYGYQVYDWVIPLRNMKSPPKS